MSLLFPSFHQIFLNSALVNIFCCKTNQPSSHISHGLGISQQSRDALKALLVFLNALDV